MIRNTRIAAACSLLLFLALLLGAARVQVLNAPEYDHNPANRRHALERYAQPRGDIYAAGRRLTGSADTRQGLRYERSYTDGRLYAPVTGFASQLYGATLLEDAEDRVLAGTDGRLAPLPLWGDLTRSRQPGGQVHTTVVPAVQKAAFRGLRGRKGAVVALEPATGRVLALVSSPGYDPALLSGNSPATTLAWDRLADDPAQPLLNRAIRQTYPPGSTFKVITAVAALESGVVTDIDAPTRTPSPYRLIGSTTLLRNESSGCADAPLREAFAESCNTVFAKLGATVGTERIVETAEAFGFNDGGLSLPSPVLPSHVNTRMDPAQVALSAIGQYDTRATPLQMARVAATIANGGRSMRPYLVDRLADAGGETVARTRPAYEETPMNPGTAALLRQMMIDAVTGGTGGLAAVDGLTVGGKTGTAQHGVDNSESPYAWFISWAQKPRTAVPGVAVAVVVEDAEADRADISGGGSAAPVARGVMRAALR
ncbi:peptidoglycan D,D-transpeptidase FtsI family protein [Streptomyces phytophilus]|uniref:peptidoglycan D,D-transpeptidase FtsI family protein n=1 Tax=Streptomyces phytophilus TaxID=722715 RepID=UPI0015F0CE4B|nr:penicillin-binding protein 2 [Streptomyces phytophilus]